MITLEAGRLHFRFPDVHERAHCSVSFQRTLRIPDDGAAYPLPPGFGNFPLRHLDDHSPRLPREWRSRGGVLMPMHQAEAMWIHFGPRSNVPAYPFAVKIAAGKVCAVSGEGWTNHLNRDPQDYVVPPRQPWLDGFCVEKGMIRQFVAYPMKAERYEAILAAHVARQGVRESVDMLHQGLVVASPAGMGLAPGGRMRQEIYDDPYGLDAWDQRHRSRCFVTIANSAQWMALTGEPPPTEPPTAKRYADAGLPWFDYYDGDARAVAGAEKFTDLASVAEIGATKGETPLPENESLTETRVVRLAPTGARQVREPGLSSGGFTD
ncbi:hypothetical protein [Candidatus Palauibacter sp.]|uniref:hypothetical protein n=1 Tax=Candidatus Palauibacter sp. TaxID=3101350 RepID=UPI003B528958